MIRVRLPQEESRRLDQAFRQETDSRYRDRIQIVRLAAPSGTAGAIVGYLLATTRLAFHANAPVAWIEEVMVAADSRAADAAGA